MCSEIPGSYRVRARVRVLGLGLASACMSPVDMICKYACVRVCM